MAKKNIITINGRQYDAVTGLLITSSDASLVVSASQPVEEPKTVKLEVNRATANHHKKTNPQRSQTLRRDAVKKPQGKYESTAKSRTTQRSRVTRSPKIQKFAPHPSPVSNNRSMQDISRPRPAKVNLPPSQVVRDTHQRIQAKRQTTPTKPVAMSSRELKESLISQSLEKAMTEKQTKTNSKTKTPRKSLFKKPLRTSTVMASALAVVVLGGYLAYTNMPGLSTKIAASQAGIQASYPGYKPDGYRFKGPVSYGDGELSISFASNSSPRSFTINQKKSTWDSGTVLDSYVLGQSDEYIANTSQGITVYTYSNGAAWVNGGILYTLEGDATLSTEQILRIANSL